MLFHFVFHRDNWNWFQPKTKTSLINLLFFQNVNKRNREIWTNDIDSKDLIDLDRITGLSTSKMFSNEKERKPTNSHHYTHYRHSSSSVDKLSEPNNIYRPFLHAIKAQRHSDPYSIKWITESPYRPNENGSFSIEKKKSNRIATINFLICRKFSSKIKFKWKSNGTISYSKSSS